MPVCREFRFFVDDGKVRCWHPYWPDHALEQGGADWKKYYDDLCQTDPYSETTLHNRAEDAGRAVGGSWSIDFLETKRGWYLTDMAEAQKSWHWPDCPHRGIVM